MSWSGKLLSSGTNAKTVKGDGSEYITAIMYLTPWKSEGVNVCPNAVLAGCVEGCLYTAGRGAMSNVQQARQRKTQWYAKDRAGFIAQLNTDIESFKKYCNKKGAKPVVRLNGTSDIQWETVAPSLFYRHPDVQFYDYTKISNRRNLPSNYHLTWSYSEASDKYVSMMPPHLNVAVVFRDKNLPDTFLGRKVVNGDADDLRFLDPDNVVVGLYAKGKAKQDTSGFVVNT